jgi:hypothetical protein
MSRHFKRRFRTQKRGPRLMQQCPPKYNARSPQTGQANDPCRTALDTDLARLGAAVTVGVPRLADTQINSTIQA